MIKINLHTVSGTKELIATGTEIISDFVEAQGLSTFGATIGINGAPLRNDEARMTFNEYGITGGTIRMSLVVKQNNAVSVNLEGDAVVITSAFKRDDLEAIQKYYPEAMTLLDKDENPIFRIAVVNSELGDIDQNGIIFGKTTTEDGFATATTILVNNTDVNNKEAAKEAFGRIIINMRKLEDQLSEVLESVIADKAMIDELFA